VSSSLRRGALAAATVLSIASLAACAAGNDAQTLEVKPDNAETTVGNIQIQNANVVTQPNRNSAGPAVITAKVFNNGTRDQTLTDITLPGTGAKVTLSPATGSGPIVVPAGGGVVLGGQGNASAVIANGREAAQDGNAQQVDFDLSSTGKVGVRALVVPATGYYKNWGPATPPAAGASAAPTASASSAKSATSPGATPTGTATGTAGGRTAANATPTGTASTPAGSTTSAPAGSTASGSGH
jgi:hypothetical protein